MKTILIATLTSVTFVAGVLVLPTVAIADELAFIRPPEPARSVTPQTHTQGLGEQTASHLRDYLSDPRRSGSLAGSIIGGALSAHPVGPVLGSLVGFLVGKQSMFSTEKSKQFNAGWLDAKRDIVPQAGQTMPTLSLANTQGLSFDVPRPIDLKQTLQPEKSVAGFSAEQIAAMCSGMVNVDPRMVTLCFYHQGS